MISPFLNTTLKYEYLFLLCCNAGSYFLVTLKYYIILDQAHQLTVSPQQLFFRPTSIRKQADSSTNQS